MHMTASILIHNADWRKVVQIKMINNIAVTKNANDANDTYW